jgi:multisubunit Na+/H+ antiporter MnhE subunit
MTWQTLADSPVFWIGLITGLLVLYILPSIIGAIRHVEGLGWLIAINLLPTGVGWLAGMIMAFGLPRREPPVTYRPVYYPPPSGQRW